MQLANSVAGLLRAKLQGLDQQHKQEGRLDSEATVVEQALCIGVSSHDVKW